MAHLVCKAMIVVLDTWVWEDAAEEEIPKSTYFNGVSSIANLWRCPGVPAKISRAAAQLFGDMVANNIFGKMPGRCLRNRWLSIDGIEAIIFAAVRYIGRVFAAIWGYYCDVPNLEPAPKAQGRRPRTRWSKKKKNPGAEEDEEFQERQRRTRNMAARLAQCRCFLCMVIISFVAKRPLVVFMLWLQKATKEHEEAQAADRAQGKTYLGPTPLSYLCSHKRVEIRTAVVQLLFREHDEAEGFALVWGIIPHRMVNSARKLIATLVLVQLASWDFRFEKMCDSMACLLLRCLDSPNDVVDVRRRSIMSLLRDMPDNELDKHCRYTDLPRKIRVLLRDQIHFAADTGLCSEDLWTFLLIYRARLPYQNQSVEGHISVMQRLANLGPRSFIAGISARLRNKLGDPIPISVCVDLDEEIREYMGTVDFRQRFLPTVEGVPPETLVYDLNTDTEKLAKRYESMIINRMYDESGLTSVWAFERIQDGAPIYMICWSYYYRYFVVHGVGDAESGSLFFKFCDAAPTSLLMHRIEDVLRQRANPVAETQIDVYTATLEWVAVRRPRILLDTQKRHKVKPASPPPPRPSAAAASSASSGAPAPAENDADYHDDAFLEDGGPAAGGEDEDNVDGDDDGDEVSMFADMHDDGSIPRDEPPPDPAPAGPAPAPDAPMIPVDACGDEVKTQVCDLVRGRVRDGGT